MKRWGIAFGLLGVLAVLMFLLSGCPSPKPPIPPTLHGVAFKWGLTAPEPALPDCSVGPKPCAQYVLSDNGKVVANPTIGARSYFLHPMPPKGVHTYSLIMQIVYVNGLTKDSQVPGLTVIVSP